MNYQIITDEPSLIKFIDWLPELKEHETFYLCLFARSKYVKDTHGLPHIRSDKAQLKRFTSNKDRLLDKIRQLECPIGSYRQKDIIVPQQALALYITINPRSFIKANTSSVRKLLDLALQPYNGFHPYQEVMSEIQKAKSRTEFISFDFDCSEELFVGARREIDLLLNKSWYHVVQTRGGFHVIVKPNMIPSFLKKSWYHGMRKILSKYSDDSNNAGDIMLPVIGTHQGCFTPKFLIK